LRFNPRTRTGCDQLGNPRKSSVRSFNPRTRTGCDEDAGADVRFDRVSTHAPARGATDDQAGHILARHVSTHAPARGATLGQSFPFYTCRVSTHAPARGATCPFQRRIGLQCVSTHAPARGATGVLPFFRGIMMFQPTHPHGVRLSPSPFGAAVSVFQPTHPHGVRLSLAGDAWAWLEVSTHAPARGATLNRSHVLDAILVSTHAPARGATYSAHSQKNARAGFNPRTRTGCDNPGARAHRLHCGFQPTHPHGVRRIGYFRREYPMLVSTHAPARGATLSFPVLSTTRLSFNPRTRTGCDMGLLDRFRPSKRFQPTHPHGVRP